MSFCFYLKAWVGPGCVSLQIQVNGTRVAARASDCWSRKKQKRTKGKRTKKTQNPTPKRVPLLSRLGPRFFFLFLPRRKGSHLFNFTDRYWSFLELKLQPTSS